MVITKKRILVCCSALAYFLVGLVVISIAASCIFFLANRTIPGDVSVDTAFDTYLGLWSYYKTDSVQSARLYAATGFSVFVVYLVPLFAIMGRAKQTRPLHGDARFADDKEIRKSGLYASAGIIVGKHKGKYLVQGGQAFVLLAAPTRSKKGVSMVIPNLLHWDGSCIILDMKLENFCTTSLYRESHGHDVFLFAPFSPVGQTHCWNVFDTIRTRRLHIVDDIMSVGYALYPDSGDAKSDYWNGLARNLFLGVSLCLFESDGVHPSLAGVLRFGSGSGQNQRKFFLNFIAKRANTAPLSSRCVEALNRFCSSAASENTAAGIISTFTEPLTIFVSPLVEAATSKTDFDLGELRKKKITIYLGVLPDRLASARVLLNIFFSQAVNLNTRQLPEEDPRLKHQLLLMMDEFTAIGRVGILDNAIGYIAGYNIRLVTIIQSIGQLDSVYKENTRTFVSNHETQTVYAPREQRDANEYSEMLGYFTALARTKNRSRQHGLEVKSSGSSGETESGQRRALMLPQEIKELEDTKCIVFNRGSKPIICSKPTYYNDAVFLERLAEVSPSLKLMKGRIPTETELKRIIFVERELCTTVPVINFDEEEDEMLSNLIRTCDQNEDVLSLSALDSQTNPSSASIDELVDSFFDQLEWSKKGEEEDDSFGVLGGVVEGLSGVVGIDLSVLEA